MMKHNSPLNRIQATCWFLPYLCDPREEGRRFPPSLSSDKDENDAEKLKVNLTRFQLKLQQWFKKVSKGVLV